LMIPLMEQARTVFMATFCGTTFILILTWFYVKLMFMKMFPMKINMIPRTVNGRVSVL